MSSNKRKFASSHQKLKQEQFANHHIFLSVILLAISIWAVINPATMTDWLLENVLVWLTIIGVIVFRNKIKLSKTSYTLITIFLCLQIYASHYAYMPPVGIAIGEFFHSSRNSFDRLIHFLFGFLLFIPIMEGIQNVLGISRRAAILFTLLTITACSGTYEIIEWIAAKTLNPAAGLAFIGVQGDAWDTQKDMAMAMLGSFIMPTLVWIGRLFR